MNECLNESVVFCAAFSFQHYFSYITAIAQMSVIYEFLKFLALGHCHKNPMDPARPQGHDVSFTLPACYVGGTPLLDE